MDTPDPRAPEHPVPGPFSNSDLGEWLWRAAQEHEGHRRRALQAAARAARFWPEEAYELVEVGRSLTELRAVGPWVADRIQGWLENPPPEHEVEESRRGFLTFAEVRKVLDADPSWEATPHADLQVHSTDSDGSLPLDVMAGAARDLGRTFIAVTDHSKSLRIANGMDEDRLADQSRRVRAFNDDLRERADPFCILHSIEMDVFEDGSGDMAPSSLSRLDLVLGAFHSKLRTGEDQTERYLATLRNPAIHVLAHPKARMYGRRVGLLADWDRVFEEAARLGKAMELDATPSRQDLSVELARRAVVAGVRWFSIGSDAHAASELGSLPFGMATAALAGIPQAHLLNYRTASEVRAWALELERGG